MTVQEAVGLVLQAAALAKGGEIFVLDMGEDVRIVDLAEQMIRREGLRPYVDIPIVFTEIRPGEKLKEDLDVSEKNAFRTGHARIFVCRETPVDFGAEELLSAAETFVCDIPLDGDRGFWYHFTRFFPGGERPSSGTIKE